MEINKIYKKINFTFGILIIIFNFFGAFCLFLTVFIDAINNNTSIIWIIVVILLMAANIIIGVIKWLS